MSSTTPEPDAARILGNAIRRRWYVVVLAAAVAAGAAALGAGQQASTYTAQSRVLVGSTNRAASAVPAYVTANTSIAADYARVGTTSTILDPVVAALAAEGITAVPSYVVSPIPESPLLVIESASKNQRVAVATVSAVSDALVAYVAQSTDGSALLDQATKTADAAQQALGTATTQRQALQDQYDAAEPAARPALQGPLSAAIAAYGLATQQVTATQSALNTATADAADRVTMDVVGKAQVTSNDHDARIGRAALAGLLIGLVPGIAVAVVSDRSRSTSTVRRTSQALPPSDARRTTKAGLTT